MSKIIVPKNFKSFEEYDAYFTCIKKVRGGDMVEAYFRLEADDIYGGKKHYRTSGVETDHTHIVHIAGFKYEGGDDEKDKFSKILLLGTDDIYIGFYPPRDSESRLYCTGGKFPYAHMYWAYPTDIKLKKIILNEANKISV